MWFSQKYPELYGCLWAVFNEDSKHKKALGMHKGASDLMLMINGYFAGIEVKAPASVHKRTHIEQQIEWGSNIIKHGGFYCMSSDIDIIKKFIETIIMQQEPVNIFPELNKKTIKF